MRILLINVYMSRTRNIYLYECCFSIVAKQFFFQIEADFKSIYPDTSENLLINWTSKKEKISEVLFGSNRGESNAKVL